MEEGKHSSRGMAVRTSGVGECLACVQNGMEAPQLEQGEQEGELGIRLKTGRPQSAGLSVIIHSSHPTVLTTQQQGGAFQNPHPVLSLLYQISSGLPRFMGQSPSSSPCPSRACVPLLTPNPCCPLCSHHSALILTQTMPSAWTSFPSSIPHPLPPLS